MYSTTCILNYCAAYPNSTLHVDARDMILCVFSDVSYLSVSRYRSRAARYFYITSDIPADTATFMFKPSTTTTKLTPNFNPSPTLNGSVYILCKIFSNIMSFATEAEIAAVFSNYKECLASRQALAEIGNP